MMIVRLLPVIISTLLFAAHVLRFHGFYWTLPVLLLLFTLLIRKPWILSFWQLLLTLATIQWIKISIELVYRRILLNMPYLRLALILSAITALTVFCIFWLKRKNIRSYFRICSSD